MNQQLKSKELGEIDWNSVSFLKMFQLPSQKPLHSNSSVMISK